MEIKIPLKTPISAHGEEVKTLVLRDPTLGCLEGVKLSVDGNGKVEFDLGSIYHLVAGMADIPPSAAQSIRLGDMLGVVEHIKGFLGDFLQTGGTAGQT